MKVKIKSWIAVASWKWDVPEDEVCGICRVQFDGTCPNCRFPGDDCSLRVYSNIPAIWCTFTNLEICLCSGREVWTFVPYGKYLRSCWIKFERWLMFTLFFGEGFESIALSSRLDKHWKLEGAVSNVPAKIWVCWAVGARDASNGVTAGARDNSDRRNCFVFWR